MSAAAFNKFLSNLAVSNRQDISTSYEGITTRLNTDFWNSSSDTLHSLQVGSFGRRSAIHGISDLDMVFEMPPGDLARYEARSGNGPSQMLADVRASLQKRYTRTTIRGDGPVVVVDFEKYVVEVLPAFLQNDRSYIYGSTRNGGSWERTNPRIEMEAFNTYDTAWNGNARALAKMMRAWKNNMGAPMGGYLIDTLVVQFFLTHVAQQNASAADYPNLLVTLFAWLSGLDNDGTWPAPGSGDPVKAKGQFTGRARKALRRCQQANDATDLVEKTKKWRSVFGRSFPVMSRMILQETVLPDLTSPGEEFIEDKFPVDIRYRAKLDYEVMQNNVMQWRFMQLARRDRRLPFGYRLRFFLRECNVPEPYNVRWKVKNRGHAARGKERGGLEVDGGNREKYENTNFEGDHYVEIYLIKNGVCVARDRAEVPIVVA
ncbi:MAG: hypothetical protein JNJ62_13590 [Pseudoxanthomonas mexicana]|nr:hypothetical protein [Pseudoxanthomonas mexicana]